MMTSRDFLLLLLDSSEGTLESETRVQKLAFLGIKEKNLPEFTSFVWEKYGPLSKELWRTSREMESHGLLSIKEDRRLTIMGDPYMVRIFELTPRGRVAVGLLKKRLGHEHDLIKKVYQQYGEEPLDVLLDYVHCAYSRHDL